MRLHTSLTGEQVRAALTCVQRAGHITPDVAFAVFAEYRSHTHRRAFEIQLGTGDKYSLPAGYTDQNGKPMRLRRPGQGGNNDLRFAATWHEWGWFIAELFEADPGSRWGADPARCGGRKSWGYFSPDDFHGKTGHQFDPCHEPEPDDDDPEPDTGPQLPRPALTCPPGPAADPVVFGPVD